MKTLAVKIEKDLLQITLLERTPKELLISMSKSFDLPDYLKKDIKNQPQALADFVQNCLENGQFLIRDVILLFDSNLGFFKEYYLKKSNNESKNKLFHIEDDNMRNREGGPVISQRLDYKAHESNEKMDKSAIYGINDSFLRELVKALRKNNINTVYATSSLVLYMKTIECTIDLIKLDKDKVDNVIGLDINKDSFMAVVFNDNHPVHLEEFSLSKDSKPEDKNLTDVLTDFLKKYSNENKKKTQVIISGTENVKAEAKRLKSYSDINCKSIMTYYEEIRDTYELVDALKDEDHIFPSLFPICGINIKKDKDESYLYGGWSKRRFSKKTTKLTVAVAVILAILFSLLPIYNMYMDKKNEELTAEIQKPKYQQNLTLLREYRNALSKLNAYQNDEASIHNIDVYYSDILATLNEELLHDATINDLFFDEESGLIIDFDVTDEDEYKKAVEKINKKRDFLIVETSAIDADSGSGKNYQIKVTIQK